MPDIIDNRTTKLAERIRHYLHLSRQAHFAGALPHSDALFVQAFWHARTEMFWEFHRSGVGVFCMAGSSGKATQ